MLYKAAAISYVPVLTPETCQAWLDIILATEPSQIIDCM